MNVIFIIAHAPLAHALRDCALHVFPDAKDDVLALDVLPDDPPEVTLKKALAVTDGIRADGVLLLTDVFGATPCNVARRLLGDARMRLVAGGNLTMLLRSVGYRHAPLDELLGRALSGGAQGVMTVAPQGDADESDR